MNTDQNQHDDVITSFKHAPSRTVTASGVTYAYRELGRRGGVPVIFLVHLAATLDNWDPRVVDGIAARRRVITFDNRGVGATEGRTPGSIAEMAKDAGAFIRALGFDQVDLLGFSMGGFVAGSYALAHPEAVEHLILVDSGGFSPGVHPFNGVYFNLPPQRVVRWAGPLGPALVGNGREVEVARVPYPEGALIDYYYQISAAPGSGEVAFRKLLGIRAWALPLLDELHALPMATTAASQLFVFTSPQKTPR